MNDADKGTPEELKNLDKILISLKHKPEFLSKEFLEQMLMRLAGTHGYYIEGTDSLMDAYLRLPHSRDLMHEILVDFKSELVYLRAKADEMKTTFNEDNLPGLTIPQYDFLSEVQLYTLATSGIFIDYNGNQVDILAYMNESAFTLKENYKEKYPAASLKYEFRTETGQLIGDDLGYKMFCVNNNVKEIWLKVALAFSAAITKP